MKLSNPVLLLLVTLFVIYCGTMTPAPPTPASMEMSAAPAAEEPSPYSFPVYVGFVQAGADSAWRVAGTMSMLEAFTEEKGYRFEIAECRRAERQVTAVRDFIIAGADLIVLSPNTETGWDEVLDEARESGIFVVILDRMIETSDDSLFTAWVGSDFQRQGYMAAEALATVLYTDMGLRPDENVNIVTIQGTLDSLAQIGRTGGFAGGMADYPSWAMLDSQPGNFMQEDGRAVMESFLTVYDDIDVVIAENDSMAFGAIEAIEAAGKSCGSGGDIVIISYGGTYAAFEQMIAGKIKADVECSPQHGSVVEQLVSAVMDGRAFEKTVYVPDSIFYYWEAGSLIGSRTY